MPGSGRSSGSAGSCSGHSPMLLPSGLLFRFLASPPIPSPEPLWMPFRLTQEPLGPEGGCEGGFKHLQGDEPAGYSSSAR